MAARSHIGGGKRVSNDPCATKPEQAKAASPTASASGFSELAEPRLARSPSAMVDTQGARHFQTLHATNTLLWRVNIHLTWPAVRCRDAVRSRWRHERRGAALALLLQARHGAPPAAPARSSAVCVAAGSSCTNAPALFR